MGEIKVSLEQEAAADEPAPIVQKAIAVESVTIVKTEPVAQAAPPASHRNSITLKPGEGAEVKLSMKKDSKVVYQWIAEGGPINFDTHGDSSTLDYYGYGKGRQVKGDKGVLTAEFDGYHGWFWRNRSDSVVTITLDTQGEYLSIERKL